MEFLVEFEVTVPDGTVASEVKDREEAEASAATTLADEGHLLRAWKQRDSKTVVGLYRAEDDSQLERLLATLPLRRVDGRHREGARAPSQRPCGRCREPTGADDASSAPGPSPEPVSTVSRPRSPHPWTSVTPRRAAVGSWL